MLFACCASHDLTKTDAAKITKLDGEMLHDEFWKPVYFGVRKSKVKATSHKNMSAWGFALLWVLASSGSFTANFYLVDC